MVVTPSLKRQHSEILTFCDALLDSLIKLKKKGLSNDVHLKNSISLLNSLLGKLLIHLSMKDKVLYPKALAAKDNIELSNKALELMQEMGNLKQSILTFREEVMRNKTISDIDEFYEQTSKFLDILKQHIRREEIEFYPLFFEQKKESFER